MRKWRQRSTGFTLVELLVVIAIITVLIGMLLPALSKVRYQANVVNCSARLRQVGQAYIMYGNENHGFLPYFPTPIPTGAANLWDQSPLLYDVFVSTYRFPHLMMFCPFMSDELTNISTGYWNQVDAAKDTVRLGYCFWVPYYIVCYGTPSGNKIIPPDPGDGQGFTINGTTQISGPKKLGDPIAITNPIATDVVFTNGSTMTPTDSTNLSELSQAQSGVYLYSNHQRIGGIIDSFNACWLDGHVETLPGGSIHPRFLSWVNYWNWR